MKHTISVLVENEFGVLSRIVGLFSGRGFNINSLSVAPTLDPTISRMTIVTHGNDQIAEQVTKQLRRLIDVNRVTDLTEKIFVEREMLLVKVNADPVNRAEILRICDIFRGKIIDVSIKTMTLEVTGTQEKLIALLSLLKPMGIKEIARTGKVAMTRGQK